MLSSALATISTVTKCLNQFFNRGFIRMLAVGLLLSSGLTAQTVVRKTVDGFQFVRNGSPYYVKGVGGDVNMELAVRIGANSIRTWGIENAKNILDEAQRNGLSVMLGLWLQHERHGFDYDDTIAVRKQFEHFKAVVNAFKDHPALLMWGVGNELDLNYTNTNAWYAVQQIAKYIHEVDPNHPTSTVTAGLDSMEVVLIKQRAPDVDVYCVNTYGDIANVPDNISRFGWTGPYMITEWGPNGYWEAPQTPWKVSVEQTSAEKKKIYHKRYTKYIAPYPNCLGSYAFLWGSKQEYTETWFGLFSKDNEPTEPIDALEMVFKGRDPVVPCPTLNSLSLSGMKSGDEIRLKAGNRYDATVSAGIAMNMEHQVPDSGSNLNYEWKILAESEDKKSGGDQEEAASQMKVTFRNGKRSSVSFCAPDREGAYRLFVKISGYGKVAYGNIPFLIEQRTVADGPAHFVSFKRQTMEFSR